MPHRRARRGRAAPAASPPGCSSPSRTGSGRRTRPQPPAALPAPPAPTAYRPPARHARRLRAAARSPLRQAGADDAGLGEPLQRHAVRLVDRQRVPPVEQVHHRERPRPPPADRAIAERAGGLLPPHPAVRRVGGEQAARLGHARRVRDRERVPGVGDRPGEPARARARPRAPPPRPPPALPTPGRGRSAAGSPAAITTRRSSPSSRRARSRPASTPPASAASSSSPADSRLASATSVARQAVIGQADDEGRDRRQQRQRRATAGCAGHGRRARARRPARRPARSAHRARASMPPSTPAGRAASRCASRDARPARDRPPAPARSARSATAAAPARSSSRGAPAGAESAPVWSRLTTLPTCRPGSSFWPSA